MTKPTVLVLVLFGVVCAQAALIRFKRAYDILGSPVLQESNCPSDGIFPIPGDCTAYIICKDGRERKRQCHDGMRYDSVKFCTPDEDADCGVVTAEAQAMVDLCPRMYGIFPVHGNCQQYVTCHDGRGTVQTCPEGTGYVSHVGCSAEFKCAMHGPVKPIGDCPSNGIFPIPGDCTAYTICKDGRERKRQCPEGMRYDSVKFCTLDENADCGVVTAEAQAMVDLCPSMYGMFPVPHSCSQYVICHEGRGTVQTCPEGTVYLSHVGCLADAQCTMHGPQKLKGRKVCDLPLDSGPCYGAIPKFYYDKDSNSCKGFTYGGCEGNDNNFNSKSECMMTCFPEKRECPSDGIFPIPGDCTAYTICKNGRERKRQCPDGMRYDSVKFCTLDENADCGVVSFEAQAMADLCPRLHGIFPVPGICHQYVVCHDGRGTLETCPEGTVYVSHVGCSAEALCSPAKGPEKPKDKKVCDLPLDSGPCYGDIPKFYYDKDSNSCKGFTYGGCEGNDNNFNTKSECMMTCYPEQHWNVCYLPRDSGPCYGDFPRFYYDMDSKSCKSFTYGGCQGNGNNFETKRECNEKCLLKQ